MNHPINTPSQRRRGLAAGLIATAALSVLLAGAAQARPIGKSLSALLHGGGQARPVGSTYDYSRWDSYLGSQSSQFSSFDQINTSNVAKLGVTWTYEISDKGSTQFDPLVVNGVMYALANNTLIALDPATGKELWKKPIQGRAGSRGMNYWQSKDGKDRRLLFVNNGMLTAVSAATGEPIATFGDGGKVDLRVGLEGDISKIRPMQTDNPGRVYKDLIIMSLPGVAYDFAGPPADIHAYDIRTGKLVWVFHTIPKKSEFGSDTWPDKDREKFGGVHNWSESTIDPELGIMYIPTGTARYDFYGGNRPGNNLFANSILAIDAKTGKRIWHFQTVHHDLWDYDLPIAPKLLTIHRDGKDIPVVVQASKQGFVYVLDRRDGKPIWPIEERPVPASDVPGEKASPTQPFPTWPKPFARQSFTEADINPYIPEKDREHVREILRSSRNEGLFTPPSLQGTISVPGHNGGANWGSAAVDPQHQRFFVVAKQLPTLDKLTLDPKPEAAAAMPNGGGDVKPYKSQVDFMLQSNSLSAINPPWSLLTAYDMNSGDIIWQVPNGDVMPLAQFGITGTGAHSPRSGPVATAGGLVFVATSSDRKFRARDAATGKVLWEHDLPAGADGVPAVYEAGGRQFVVIPVGGNGGFSTNLGLPKPGPAQYIAFALPRGDASTASNQK